MSKTKQNTTSGQRRRRGSIELGIDLWASLFQVERSPRRRVLHDKTAPISLRYPTGPDRLIERLLETTDDAAMGNLSASGTFEDGETDDEDEYMNDEDHDMGDKYEWDLMHS